MLALELEVLAKKYDRFGWDRDRNSPAQDRLIIDWMEALSDFPLDEVQAACRAHVEANPKSMPHEGHIKALIIKAREVAVLKHRAALPPPQERKPLSVEERRAISEKYLSKKFPTAGETAC